MEAVRARSVGPTAGQERYEFLDVLRGLALVGIVLANMISLSLYLYLSESERASLSTASTDRVFEFLCGVLLLPFVRAGNRTILAAAAGALLVPLVFSLWGVLPPETFLGPRQLLFERFGFTPETRVAIWSAGSLRDIVLLNASSWFGQFDYVVTSGMIFKIYGSFLLGLYFGRNELHKHLPRFTLYLRRIAVLGITTGLPLNALYA